MRTWDGLNLTSGGQPTSGLCLWPEGAHGEPGYWGPAAFPVVEKVVLPPTRHRDVEHDSKFLDMCCLASEQRDFCSI